MDHDAAPSRGHGGGGRAALRSRAFLGVTGARAVVAASGAHPSGLRVQGIAETAQQRAPPGFVPEGGGSTRSPRRCRASTRRRGGCKISGLVEHPLVARPTTSCSRCRGRGGRGLPLRHGVERRRRCGGPASASTTCSPPRGQKPEAHALTFVSAEEPYTDSLTLEQARLPQVMLAYEMDGKPLSRAHGAPVRVVIPEMYGYKNTKWVGRSSRGAEPMRGLLGADGYDRDAWVGAPTVRASRRLVRRFTRTERADPLGARERRSSSSSDRGSSSTCRALGGGRAAGSR